MDRIHIMHLAPHLNIGGAEMLIYQLAKKIDRNRFKPIVATWQGGVLEKRLHSIGVEVLHVQGYPKSLRIYSIARLLKEYNVDILHTHLFVSRFYGQLAAITSKNVCVIHTYHGMTFKEKGLKRMIFETLLSPHADCLIAVSESVRTYITKTLHWKKERVKVIPNGVEIERFHTERKKFHDIPTIVSGGRLSPEKGFDILIKAVKILVEDGMKIRCILAGEGREYGRLLGLVENLNLKNNFIFAGYVEDMREIFEKGDIFVISSHHEGLPLTLLEAMASGMPVVSTSVGGIPEVVTSQTGYLVEPENPSSLASAIKSALTNPEEALRKGRTGYEKVSKHYTLQKTVDEYEKIYMEVIKGR